MKITEKQIKKSKRNKWIFDEYMKGEKSPSIIQKEANKKFGCDLEISMIFKIIKKKKDETTNS